MNRVSRTGLTITIALGAAWVAVILIALILWRSSGSRGAAPLEDEPRDHHGTGLAA